MKTKNKILVFFLFALLNIGYSQTQWIGGSVDRLWSNKSNWSSGAIPGTSTDVVLGSGDHPIVDGTTNNLCRNITLTDDATITFLDGSRVLKVYGNFTNSTGTNDVFYYPSLTTPAASIGTFPTTGELPLSDIEGSAILSTHPDPRSACGTVEFRRSGSGTSVISGSTNFGKIVIIPGSGRYIQINTGTKVNIYYSCDLASGEFITSGSDDMPRLVLKSNINDSGFIIDTDGTGGKLNNSNNLVEVERYITENFRSYHLITPPVTSQAIGDFKDNSLLTTYNNSSLHPWTYSYSYTNWCDPSWPFPNVSYYDETAIHPYPAPPPMSSAHETMYGWTSLEDNDAVHFEPGKGYYVRFEADNNVVVWGDRSGNVGTVLVGNVDIPVTNTSYSDPNDGWNLIANPYPSPIDWNAWDYSNSDIGDIIAVFDSEVNNPNSCEWSGANCSYNLATATGTNGFDGRMSISQGFWVYAAADTDFPFTDNLRYYPSSTSDDINLYRKGFFHESKMGLTLMNNNKE